jgi:hypothetical protein
MRTDVQLADTSWDPRWTEPVLHLRVDTQLEHL